VRALPRIAFQRHDRLADKAVDPRFEFDQVRRKGKIDHGTLLKRALDWPGGNAALCYAHD
jgi:hypothetical protein